MKKNILVISQFGFPLFSLYDQNVSSCHARLSIFIVGFNFYVRYIFFVLTGMLISGQGLVVPDKAHVM